jgi:hypothetical protein
MDFDEVDGWRWTGEGVLPYDLQNDKLDFDTRKSLNRRKQNILSQTGLMNIVPIRHLSGATRLSHGFLAMPNLMR